MNIFKAIRILAIILMKNIACLTTIYNLIAFNLHKAPRTKPCLKVLRNNSNAVIHSEKQITTDSIVGARLVST